MPRRRLYAQLPILLTFLLLLGARLYWISCKENLYGDEMTSVCIAFGNPGWGRQTFDNDRVYTGSELRKLTYTDSENPNGGVAHDLRRLHRYNSDPSHASLYYMALRCALADIDAPNMKTLVWRGCGLNLLFFSISFAALALLLQKLFPTNAALQAFCLIIAFANPAAMSTTLFVREYAMAGMFLCLFALWLAYSPGFGAGISRKPTAGWAFGGAAITACLVSCGYFNAAFVALSFALIAYRCIRAKEKRLPIWLLGISAAAVVVCWAMYLGFFNFIIDDRTAEVSDKLQGGSLINNLKATAIGIGYIFLKRILTLPLLFTMATCATYLYIRRRLRNIRPNRIELEFLAIGTAWMIAVLWLATWKSERFVSPAIPLAVAIFSASLYRLFASCHKRLPVIIALVTFVFSQFPGNVDHLERTASRTWRAAGEKSIYLYGPDYAEINTMPQLIPYIADNQKCVILKDMDDLHRFATNTEKEVHVFGSNGCEELEKQVGLSRIYNFNTWTSDYVIRP